MDYDRPAEISDYIYIDINFEKKKKMRFEFLGEGKKKSIPKKLKKNPHPGKG